MSHPAISPLFDAARAYLARGWSVIPCHGKRAAVPWQVFQDRRPTEAELRAGFRLPSVDAVAVVLGEVSDWLVCRDFDVADSYRAWAKAHPDLARSLPTVKTAQGFHVYGRHVAELRTHKLGDGEWRGAGGYCLLPPSLHPDGPVYDWLVKPDGKIPTVDPSKAGLDRAWLADCPNSLTTGRDGTNGIDGMDGNDGIAVAVSSRLSDVQDFAPLLESCLPTSPGQNDSRIWRYAQGIRALEERAGRGVTFAELQELFGRWWERNQHRPPEGREFILDKFSRAYSTVRAPLGMAAEGVVWTRALLVPVPAIATRYPDEQTRRAVTFCREMQRYVGDRDWPLTYHQYATVAGLPDDMAAYRILKRLTNRPEPVLKLVRCGDRGALAGRPRRPSIWRYLPPLDPLPETERNAHA
jgi:hypothetical protein